MIRTFWLTCVAALLVTTSIAAEVNNSSTSVRLQPRGTNQYPPVITAIAIDPLGEWIAASGDDHLIRILSRQTMTTAHTLAKHVDWVRGMEFSPSGSQLVSAGNDGQLVFWDRGNDWASESSLDGAPALRCATFSPDGKMVASVGFAPQVFLLGLENNERPKLNCGCRDLRAVDYRWDSLMLAAAGRSGDVHLYDAVTGSTLGEVQLHRARIAGLGFIGKTDRVYTVGEDGHAIVYDTETRSVIHDFEVARCKLLAGCMIDDVHLAVGGSDNTIRIFNLETGSQVAKLSGHTGSVAALAAANGELYSGSFDTTLRRWNVKEILGDQRVAEIEAGTQPDARTSRLPTK